MPEYDFRLLEGVIDTHIHTSPDAYRKRKYNDLEIAAKAQQLKIKAVVLKSHTVLTADRAYLAEKVCPDVRVLGGLALNDSVGGLNPNAVDVALELDARIIWLPTVDAEFERTILKQGGGIRCVQDGHVVKPLEDILKLIAERNCVLATGHISKEEQLIVIDRAKELGVQKILVNHPELTRIGMTIEEQRRLLSYGVFFERCHSGSQKPYKKEMKNSIDDNIQAIHELGCESTVIATDLGQPGKTEWYLGMLEQIVRLRDAGFTAAQIHQMTCDNASWLLGI